jgi:hypothetical protein
MVGVERGGYMYSEDGGCGVRKVGVEVRKAGVE